RTSISSGVVTGLPIARPQALGVLDDGPDLVFCELALECRHLRLLPAVPDLVEQNAVGITRPARLGQIGRGMLFVAVGAVALPLWTMAFRALAVVDRLAFLENVRRRRQRALVVAPVFRNLPPVGIRRSLSG